MASYSGNKGLTAPMTPVKPKELMYMPGYAGHLPSTMDMFGYKKSVMIEARVK
jgi:hypothetical protein